MNYSQNFSTCIQAACILADSMRHQFLTPEHLLLAIPALPAWKKCTASIPEPNVIYFEFELGSYINEMEQTPEDIWEEIKQTQEYQGIPVSELMQELFNRIEMQCAYSERDEADIEHALHALFYLDGSTASYLLNSIVTDRGGFIGALIHENRMASATTPTADELLEKMNKTLREENEAGNSFVLNPDQLEGDCDTHRWINDGYESSSNWHDDVVCLNDIAEQRNPLIGRERELERTIQVLCRKEKNNPLHIGEPGVGKTAIVYGLARMINEENVPERLKGAKIYRMEMGGLVAGTRYRGDFEEKMKKILDGVAKEGNSILYIDEIHTMMGAGSTSESSLDASNILKRYLEESDIRFIGATTFEDHKRSMGRNRAISRRFQE
ncbi:MAG: AAA family ATPase, partial [Muribaculaceae bacterium]|nr:AAA family ATPase [Muribaculaceae bacterium]